MKGKSVLLSLSFLSCVSTLSEDARAACPSAPCPSPCPSACAKNCILLRSFACCCPVQSTGRRSKQQGTKVWREREGGQQTAMGMEGQRLKTLTVTLFIPRAKSKWSLPPPSFLSVSLSLSLACSLSLSLYRQGAQSLFRLLVPSVISYWKYVKSLNWDLS